MRMAVGQQDALKYETPSKKSQLLQNILIYSLDDDYIEQRNQLLSEIPREELNQLARQWFNPQEYQVIVVGDAEKLIPQLKALNIPVKRLEIEQ